MAAATGRTRPTTIYSVAERAGVSIATVSRVLQGSSVVTPATRERVLEAVDGLGYVPLGAARSLAARRYESHGLILPELGGDYYADVLIGFESTAGSLGQSVVLVVAQGRADFARAARTLAARVDGLAVMGSAGLPTSTMAALAQRIPVVVIAGTEQTGCELVRADSLPGAKQLTLRLLRAGRNRVCFIGDPDQAVDVAERYDGFKAAHHERGLEAPAPVRCRFDESAGVNVADRLVRMAEPPDALVCANDLVAVAAMNRLQQKGVRVPDDMAVTGWDDILAARYTRPRLTTARQPVRELAALGARRLHERINGDEDWGATHVLPCEVVIRESCGTKHPNIPKKKVSSI
ncbi:MAG TPA: LacI family DNA-binding transcriptional regulator [Dermatophilaceae bacterium]|nr:LacI family DNA-binding transcriptional regulator [Dermatophilaceae bacterium]